MLYRTHPDKGSELNRDASRVRVADDGDEEDEDDDEEEDEEEEEEREKQDDEDEEDEDEEPLRTARHCLSPSPGGWVTQCRVGQCTTAGENH